MPAYVIYARKSTASDDRQVLSIDSQIHELRTLAARQGVSVAEVLTESKSAKAPGRPIFGELIRRVHRGAVNGILCWKMDRLARNHLDTGQVLQALADGLLERVITIDRTYTRDGNDRFIGNFELGMATKYIDDLRQNVKRGLRAKLQQGWATGKPPLGYLNDKLNKTIVKDPERFDLVRRMWDLMLTGTMRPDQIRTIANEEWGFRTRKLKREGGRPLAHASIYHIFGNPFYMGHIRNGDGETFVGRHPPMVTREEFLRVHEILGRPGRPRPQEHEFPFTGLFHCGNCGASITAEEHVKPSGRRYVYYHCTRRKDVPCREPAIPAPELEAQMVSLLGRFRLPDKVHAWLLDKARHDVNLDRQRREEAHRSLEIALRAARGEEETLLSLRLRELVTDDVFLAKRRDLQEHRQGLELKIRSTGQGLEDVQKRLDATFLFAQKAQEMFENGTGVQKRMILEAAGSNWTLKSKKVAVQAEKPLQLIAESGGLSANLRDRDSNPNYQGQNLASYH